MPIVGPRYAVHKKKNKRIIDGNQVVEFEFPFMAAVLDNETCFCGGSIISKSYILTASHCFYDEFGPILQAEDLSVSLGSVLWRNGTQYKVARIIEHDKYNNELTTHDLALLKLAEDIQFTPNIKPIIISKEQLQDHLQNYTLTVVGWGFYADMKRRLVFASSETLMRVDIQSIPWFLCKKYYEDISKSNLCMTSSAGKGTCNGDSGGPLITQTPDGWVQFGLVSYGGDCNNTQPEVYTRLSSYYSWIKRQIGSDKNTRRKNKKKVKN